MLKEQIWEFKCSEFGFNGHLINKITVTDHFLLKHSHLNENLIYQVVLTLPKEVKVWKIHNHREIYVWNEAYINNKRHRLIFWLKDNTNNHIWIRNCYPIY